MTANANDHMVIHPRRNKKEQPIPENGLLLVNPSEAADCLDNLRRDGGMNRFLFNSGLVVAATVPYFAAGPAIGAPMAVLTLEKLIALGAKKVILFGWCGAISPRLRIGDILVPRRALSGEGTSAYYSPEATIEPDLQFCDQIAALLVGNNLPVERDCVWSTDAVYREDRRLLQQLYQEDGVGAVDMEFSALCAVARFRDIRFAGVLTVSDELWGDSWRPGFSRQRFIEKKQAALTLLQSRLGDFGI